MSARAILGAHLFRRRMRRCFRAFTLGMGGTGLSGLALSDARGSFPGAYADVFYVANPVMQRVQAVKLFRMALLYPAEAARFHPQFR